MTPKRTRRLRARAAAIPQNEEYEDYGPEPNMKLSHAFLVVLLLHVVAVGGLYAFNTMKAGRPVAAESAGSSHTVAKSATPPQASGGSDVTSGGKGEAPKNGSGGKPPAEEPPAPVAKTGGDTSDRTAGSKGWMSSIRNALHKGGGAAIPATALAAKASAQDVPAGGSAAGAKTYLVKAGDTVTRIAGELGVAIPELEKANGLKGDSVLQVGQVLKVPQALPPASAGTVATTPPAATSVAPSGTNAVGATAEAVGSAPAADVSAMQEYTVVKGDNPYKLAKKFRVTPDELMKANGITDPKKIQIGQKLRVPPASQKSKSK